MSLSLLDQALRQPLRDGSMTLEFKSATKPPIGYDELVRRVISGDGAGAAAELRLLAAETPSHPLLAESSLARLCVSLLYTWNLAEQTLPLA